MSGNKIFIQELKEKIERSKLILQEQEKALQIVEAMLSDKTYIPTHGVNQADNIEISNKQIMLDSLPTHSTFKDEVFEIIKKLGDQEFNVVQIESVFTKIGKPVTGSTPRSRISMSLSKLIADGKIIRTFQGSGHVPHRYKIKYESSDIEDKLEENNSTNSKLDSNESY